MTDHKNNILKKMPIGVSDFKKLIKKNYYYIDKTLFIKELVLEEKEVSLIPRPRRFGKTLNLSMLQYFFEKSEEDHSSLFNNTAIQNEKEIWALQGTYPAGQPHYKAGINKAFK